MYFVSEIFSNLILVGVLFKMTLFSYRIPYLAPYFIETQRTSFLNFLKHGLIYELSKRNPILDPCNKFSLIFYPEYYQLRLPDYTPKQAILKGKTYGSNLYVPLQLKYYKSNRLKLQWVLIGNLPLMTKRGHFIVNGTARVVVNQMVRSPGIYYSQAFNENGKPKYYGDFIPDRGNWLRLEIDTRKRVWVRLKKTPKIPIFFFLKSIGLTEDFIKTNTTCFSFLENSKNKTLEKYGHPENMEEALKMLLKLVFPRTKEKDLTAENGKNYIFRKFFSYKTYDLSKIGRTQLNEKLLLCIQPSKTVLTPQDILFATENVVKLEHGMNILDDIDHLKNRRVKAAGELVQNQLGTGFIRLEKFIKKKIEDTDASIFRVISSKPVNGALREFFGSSPLSQFMDQTNPLAELTHKRRLSSLGPGGVSRETAGMAIRGIHPTHYGRICPIETPEGQNAGLVNSLTTLSKVNNEGFLETPFYSVHQGQLQKYDGVHFFSAVQEEYSSSAPGDLKTDYLSNLPSTMIPVKASGEFKKLAKKKVEYMSVSPVQMISVATSLIPFLEHDDANRALMGSNMQRQAVPLVLPEKAVVGTGLEARVISDSGHGIQAKKSGFVSYVSGESIKIENFFSISYKKPYEFSKKMSTLFSKKKKEYVVYMNMKIYKKFVNKNFLYLSDLLIHTYSPIFEKKISNKKWLGFNKVYLLQDNFINAFYFANKRKIFSLKNKNVVNITNNVLLLHFNEKKFFTSKLIKKTRKKNVQNTVFFSQNTLVFREQYASKIHFLTLSEKILKHYFDFNSIKTKFWFNVFFPKIFLVECINLLNAQTYLRKKNLKHIFFSKSSAWHAGSIKKFTFIKLNKKLCTFLHHSPYKTITKQLVTENRNSIPYNTLLSTKRNSQFFRKKQHKQIFSFALSSSSFFPQSFSNFIGFSKNQLNSFNFSTSPTLSSIFSTKIVDHNIDDVSKKINTYQLYKTLSLLNTKKFKNKVVKKFTNFYHIKNKVKNFIFSSHSCCFHETKNYVLQSYQRSNQNTCIYQRPIVSEGEWVQKGDLLADGAASVQGELALGKTLLVAYMPWEGYNFEDAIVVSQRLIYDDLYTSIHIERYEIQIFDTEYGLEQITLDVPDLSPIQKRNLNNQGIVQIGSWVEPGDVLVGKITPIKKKKLSGYERLLADILNLKKDSTLSDTPIFHTSIRDSSLRVPKHVFGRIVHIEFLEAENIPKGIPFHGPGRVYVYIAEKRRIQIGDKMSGRHGNKGIISRILPREDMPYLPDGTPVDMVLNPLGVPSRMNVGQIFECILGLAGKELYEQFKINSFDEMNGPEASRSLAYSKLFEARLKTNKKWICNLNHPGKMKIFDGRTGEPFAQTVTTGKPYMLKLIHLVDEKIHARSTGPYSLVTQQPLRGRSKHGGQRLGEMEVWALEGFGAAYILQELLTVKSDDIKGRKQVMDNIVKKKSIKLGTPECFKVLLSELQSLCLDIGVYSITNSGIRKKINMLKL